MRIGKNVQLENWISLILWRWRAYYKYQDSSSTVSSLTTPVREWIFITLNCARVCVFISLSLRGYHPLSHTVARWWKLLHHQVSKQLQSNNPGCNNSVATISHLNWVRFNVQRVHRIQFGEIFLELRLVLITSNHKSIHSLSCWKVVTSLATTTIWWRFSHHAYTRRGFCGQLWFPIYLPTFCHTSSV